MCSTQRKQLQQEKAIMSFVVTALAGGVGEEKNQDFIQSLPRQLQKKPPELSSARRRDRDGETKAQSVVRCSSGGGCAGVL